MVCGWGHNDCQNQNNNKCLLCFSEDFHYLPTKIKKKPQLAYRQQKADKRMGSSFEYKNHQDNAALLANASSNMTPNSGAGKIKGDESITGIIEVMEELKTKITKQAPGKETFTIKKEWLDKLRIEAAKENKEFHYLKFSFYESDEDVYVITEKNIIMSLIASIVSDRKAAKQAFLKIDIADKRRQKAEADLVAAQAEINLLKAELEFKGLMDNKS